MHVVNPKDIENWALRYLARRWSVIPVHARDKRPAIRWKQYQYKIADEEEVRNWFHQQPEANIGIVTGKVSNLVVIDVDPGHGGAASIAGLEGAHARLPHTIEAVTGSGGRHIYFIHPGFSIYNRVGLKPGIDLRGDGGYVVAPPSLHPSGKRYAWKGSHHPDDTPLVRMPDWLIQLAIDRPGSKSHPPAH